METAAIIAGSNSPDILLDHLITAGNNKHGSSPFASRRQVLTARNEKLVISKDDWEASYENLYKNKQGKYVNTKKKTCVLSVKNLKEYIEKIANKESENLIHSEDSLKPKPKPSKNWQKS